jgi:uncharacterized membrane protein
MIFTNTAAIDSGSMITGNGMKTLNLDELLAPVSEQDGNAIAEKLAEDHLPHDEVATKMIKRMKKKMNKKQKRRKMKEKRKMMKPYHFCKMAIKHKLEF